jgi:hypothetical protein
MQKSVRALVLLILCAATALASGPGTGVWDVIATTPQGETMKWTVTIREADGRLTGEASRGETSVPLLDLKADGSSYTCKVKISEGDFEARFTVDGDTMTGRWSGEGESGPLKGKRKG